MNMPLDAATIERIVNLQELAPREYRHLTYEAQLKHCDREVLREQSLCGPYEVVRVEEVARGKDGEVLLDKDGSPKIVERKVLKRDVAGANQKAMKARVQAEYRAWLQVDPKQRAVEQDRKRFDFERAERARKFEAHEAAEAKKTGYRDSRFMHSGD